MPSSHDAIPEVPSASPAGPGEEEPRLRYGSLDADAPYRPSQSTTTRLCVSDKVLAVGHRDGTVELLDHLGNQVGPGSRLKAPRHRLDGACSPARRLAAPNARCPSLSACRSRHSRSTPERSQTSASTQPRSTWPAALQTAHWRCMGCTVTRCSASRWRLQSRCAAAFLKHPSGSCIAKS